MIEIFASEKEVESIDGMKNKGLRTRNQRTRTSMRSKGILFIIY